MLAVVEVLAALAAIVLEVVVRGRRGEVIVPPPTAAISWRAVVPEDPARISSRPNRCHRHAAALVLAPLHENEVNKG